MSLTRAIADVKRFTAGEFARDVDFETPDGLTTATVRCLVSKHNLGIDPITGQEVNSRNIHLSVAESNLTDEGYTVRDGNGECDLRKHKVTFDDANGTTHTYMIDEAMPSDTVGWIVCILSDYE